MPLMGGECFSAKRILGLVLGHTLATLQTLTWIGSGLVTWHSVSCGGKSLPWFCVTFGQARVTPTSSSEVRPDFLTTESS